MPSNLVIILFLYERTQNSLLDIFPFIVWLTDPWAAIQVWLLKFLSLAYEHVWPTEKVMRKLIMQMHWLCKYLKNVCKFYTSLVKYDNKYSYLYMNLIYEIFAKILCYFWNYLCCNYM